MRIKINDIQSMNSPEKQEVVFDDRQEIIQVDGGNIVQDYGVIDSGTTITMTGLQFSYDDFQVVLQCFYNRTKVKLTDNNGDIWESVRIKIDKYSYVDRFVNYVICDMKFYMI